MLSLDKDLNKFLNIKKATADDIPEDFYTTIAILMKGTIKAKLESLTHLATQHPKKFVNENDLKLSEIYERLDKLDLIRDIIKKTIMTIPYNVSFIQGIRYLKESFEYGDNSDHISNLEENNIEENTTHKNDQ
jgi:hypothetical protein